MPCGENWLAASGSEALFAGHEDGYGSAVVYLDQHILAEASGLHFESGGLQKLDEFVDKRLRFLRRGSIGEAGAASFAGICEESELADDQNFALGVECGEVELIRLVGEDAQIGYLVSEILGILFGVTFADADEGYESLFYGGYWSTFDADRGFGDPLHQGSHLRSLAFSSFFVSFFSAFASHSVSLHLPAELQGAPPPWSVQ